MRLSEYVGPISAYLILRFKQNVSHRGARVSFLIAVDRRLQYSCLLISMILQLRGYVMGLLALATSQLLRMYLIGGTQRTSDDT